MSTLANEYGIPSPDTNGHSNGHQNGNGHHNGNGKPKAFTIGPAPVDPSTLAILGARDKALKNPRLARCARFFCYVLDRSLDPSWYDRDGKGRGVLCMADSVAAKDLGVTARTIYDWKKLCEEEDCFWLSWQCRPNMWPMTVYNLSCLHPRPKNHRKTDSGGTYGGETIRYAPADDVTAKGREKRNAKLAAKRAQKNLALTDGLAVVPPPVGSAAAAPMTENPVLQVISAGSRKNLRPPAEENFGGEPKKISAASRKEFRRRAEENFGGEPKGISAAGRSSSPAPAEADCQHIESQKEIEIQRESLKAVNRLRNRVEDGGGEGKKSRYNPESEREFIAYCEQLFRTAKTSDGKPEWATNAGLWIHCFRQNKRKAWAVMHETKTVKTERPHTITKTLGAFAMDLWKENRVGA